MQLTDTACLYFDTMFLMGVQRLGKAQEFGRLVAEHINELVASHGGDVSGRWLAENIGRSATYWYNRQILETPFNVNDVQAIAEHFKLSALQLIENAVDETPTAIVSTLHKNRDVILEERLVATTDNDDGGEIDGDHSDH